MGIKELSYYGVSIPVFLTDAVRPNVYRLAGEIAGTCFSVGRNLLLTAGHVVETLQRSPLTPVVGVFDKYGAEMHAEPVIRTEILRFDLGLLEIADLPHPWDQSLQPLPWSRDPLQTFEDVCALGYAYGIFRSGDKNSVLQRGFRGSVVSEPVDFKPVGGRGSGFRAYELSFGAPRGLSGAPVFRNTESVQISGVVIGNSQSRMSILETEEVTDDGSSRTVAQQFESLTLGIAVQAAEVFEMASELAGGKLGEHLIRQKLLAR